MDTRKDVAATLIVGTLLLPMSGCMSVEDSCACQYPDDEDSKGTSDSEKTKSP